MCNKHETIVVREGTVFKNVMQVTILFILVTKDIVLAEILKFAILDNHILLAQYSSSSDFGIIIYTL